MNEPVRVAISGAAGNVGYSLIFRIASGAMFGQETPVELSLLDLPDSWAMLRADAMELQDCGYPLLAGVTIETTATRAFKDADWVILLGSKQMKFATRDSRADAIRSNTPLFVEQARAINEACPCAKILVVADPCNTNCLVAMQHAIDVPREHWFSLNRVDRMRAAAVIAEKAGVPLREVNRVTVWGNRSESTFVDYHNAYIGDQPLLEVIRDLNWCRGELQMRVATRSSEVAGLRGRSPAATAAQAIVGTIRSLTTPTPFERRFGAGVYTDGRGYSVPADLVFGLPLMTRDGKTWEMVHGLYLDDFAQERIAANVAELQHEAVLAAEVIANAG